MKGFTLVETLVVVSIILVLSTMAIVYNRSNERQIALYKDQAILVGLLNRAKAFTAQRYRDPATPDNPACAFGLHLDSPRSFVLFQDLGDGDCEGVNTNYRYDEGADPTETLEIFSLDPRLEFEAIPGGGLDIFFIPPEINASSSAGLPVSIVIRTPDGALQATTVVSTAGQIITE